jgi:hypothetical protein
MKRTIPSRTIGFLVSGAPSSHGPWFAALAERLRQLGWIEDRDIKIEYRWAEGRPELYTEFAAEFVRLNVDVIVALGAGPVLAAKQATSVIPIVFPASGDPVGSRRSRRGRPQNSENSKANRIETMKGPAECGQICSVGRRKIAKKIAKNKPC